jgi:uncharacterized protein YjbJ (UPF0337 family)
MGAGRRRKSASQDRVEGFGAKVRGRVREASGALTGDPDQRAAGRRDQLKGTMKEKRGLLKRLFR